MEKEQKLLMLKLYFDTRRQEGHTLAMVKGAENIQATVIVREPFHSDYIERMANRKRWIRYVSWDRFDLHGLRGPLVIDNAAMSEILGDALDLLREARKENHLLRDEVKTLKEERSM